MRTRTRTSVYVCPMADGWPLLMASHDSCDRTVVVVAPLPSVRTCGVDVGMPDTMQRNYPGRAGGPRADHFLKRIELISTSIRNCGPQHHFHLLESSSLLFPSLPVHFSLAVLHSSFNVPVRWTFLRVHPFSFDSTEELKEPHRPPAFPTRTRNSAALLRTRISKRDGKVLMLFGL